jgi:hypothetical protein
MLLNGIEHGADWPKHMLPTRAVFLNKDPKDITNPLAYRILKITSGWYRKWGSARNRDLALWIKSWDVEHINSGVPEKGAMDAWLQTALHNELNNVSGHDVAGGSIDIFKCFDQINRSLIFKIAKEAGMPMRILNPYMRYIGNIATRYQVGKTKGAPHCERASIPQGCPFSMTMIALLMVPWIRIMTDLGVKPRVLADDLMFTTHGDDHRAMTIEAMKISRTYFQDIGAKVADKKCFTFASNSSTRKDLSEHIWDSKGLLIPCVSSFRDLGAHMNLCSNNNGATLTARLRHATTMAKRLRWLPITRAMKERIVLCNIIPAGIYGAEATHVHTAAL